jgi:hypothetical protein
MTMWYCHLDAASLIDGQPIVKLPPRIVKLKQAEFSLEERSFYTKLEAESRAQFQVHRRNKGLVGIVVVESPRCYV